MSDKTLTVTSYAGGVASVASALTLTDVGIIVGIVTALGTFALNAIYQARKDRRESEAHEMHIAMMRQGDCLKPECEEGCPHVTR